MAEVIPYLAFGLALLSFLYTLARDKAAKHEETQKEVQELRKEVERLKTQVEPFWKVVEHGALELLERSIERKRGTK